VQCLGGRYQTHPAHRARARRSRICHCLRLKRAASTPRRIAPALPRARSPSSPVDTIAFIRRNTPACSMTFCLTARLSPKCRLDGSRGRAIFRGATA
jgi:hypothetical protein